MQVSPLFILMCCREIGYFYFTAKEVNIYAFLILISTRITSILFDFPILRNKRV